MVRSWVWPEKITSSSGISRASWRETVRPECETMQTRSARSRSRVALTKSRRPSIRVESRPRVCAGGWRTVVVGSAMPMKATRTPSFSIVTDGAKSRSLVALSWKL